MMPVAWRGHWQTLQARERRLVQLAALTLAAALLWLVALAPALRIARTAPERLDQIELQLQQVQRLAAQAQALQARPVVRRDDALRMLQESLRQRLGDSAQLSLVSDTATVTLRGASPQALAPWLAQVRSAARVVVLQARLNQSPLGWDGSIVLQLPAA